MRVPSDDDLPRFDRARFAASLEPGRIGGGALGTKGSGLLEVERVLGSVPLGVAGIEVHVPPWVVLGADVFEQFLKRNSLHDVATSGQSDEYIAAAFQEAALPYEVIVELWSVIETLREPLAVRPSLVVEPAGPSHRERILATKMTPNNQEDRDERLQKLLEAIKLVYASPFFRAGRGTAAGTGFDPLDSAMAVVVQAVSGAAHGNRYYPDLSGRYRSRPGPAGGGPWSESGVVELVLGLGKTIVDGGCRHSYPLESPWSVAGTRDPLELLSRTQREFWAVNTGETSVYDPFAENEYLVKAGLQAAEYDGTLKHAASTYVARSGAMVPGVATAGPRAVTFAPLLLLEKFPLNETLRRLVALFQADLGERIDLEFAVQAPSAESSAVGRLSILQLRRRST